MAEFDPGKWVRVFEHLFGPKLGRLIAQALLALGTLALGIWLVHICWEYGGRRLYESLSLPSFPTISLDYQAALTTILFLLIVYSIILLGVLYTFVRHVFRRSIPQAVIDELAELRSRAIHDILNARVQNDVDFAAWTGVDEQWTNDVLAVLRENFPRAEVLGFQRLGIIAPVAFAHSFNNEHAHKLAMFSRRLSILEDLIRRYSR